VNVVDFAERVARDLHDGPLKDVFATRLRLDAIAARVSPDIASEIHQLSQLQGRIITRMRNLTGTDVVNDKRRPSERLADTVRDASIALGFTPHCSIDPKVDLLLHTALISDIVSALRESLSNVARHARATRVRLSISVGPTTVRFTVRDNGVGIPPSGHRGNGLANLRTRAERNGGTCTYRDAAGGGTVVEWWVRTTA
jgi:signal transduction histidine kinase